MSNGENEKEYFMNEARVRITNLRIAVNEEIDKIQKWVDGFEKQKASEKRGKATPPATDDSVIESETIIKGEPKKEGE